MNSCIEVVLKRMTASLPFNLFRMSRKVIYRWEARFPIKTEWCDTPNHNYTWLCHNLNPNLIPLPYNFKGVRLQITKTMDDEMRKDIYSELICSQQQLHFPLNHFETQLVTLDHNLYSCCVETVVWFRLRSRPCHHLNT